MKFRDIKNGTFFRIADEDFVKVQKFYYVNNDIEKIFENVVDMDKDLIVPSDYYDSVYDAIQTETANSILLKDSCWLYFHHIHPSDEVIPAPEPHIGGTYTEETIFSSLKEGSSFTLNGKEYYKFEEITYFYKNLYNTLYKVVEELEEEVPPKVLIDAWLKKLNCKYANSVEKKTGKLAYIKSTTVVKGAN